MTRSFLFTPKALLLILGCLVCQAGAGLFYTSQSLGPEVLAELGWTRTMWSSAMAPMIFVSSIGQALIGAACVRYGIRAVLVASVLSLGGTFFAFAAMHSLPAFYFAMVLLAIGNAGIGDVSVGAVITRWFERSRGVALGFAFAGSNIGAVVFVHFITDWTARFGWRTASTAIGVAAIAALLPFAIFVVRDPRPGEGEGDGEGGELAGGGVERSVIRGDDVRAGGRGDAESRGGREVPGHDGAADQDATLAQALRSAGFWILFFAVFCYAVAQLGMINHLILYLVDLGYERAAAANALELTVGAGIVAKLTAGAIAVRVPARILLVANTALLAFAVALFPLAADPTLLAVAGVSFGIATSARDVLVPLVAAEFFGARFFAEIYGMMMLAYIPGGGLGPLLLARAHDLFGSYESGFAICAALLGISLVGQVVAARPGFAKRAVRTGVV